MTDLCAAPLHNREYRPTAARGPILSALPPMNAYTSTAVRLLAAFLYSVLLLHGSSEAYGADGATFISETIPDNTVIPAGQTFIKTWTLQNSGTTTWSSGANGYTLNWQSGSQMGAPNYATLSSAAAPGVQKTFSVTMTAPTAPGTYTGYWRMSSSSFALFGPTVSVKIVVNAPLVPNLTSYQPSGWSDKIVVSRATGNNTDSTLLTTADSLYVDWAVINNGSGATAVTFYTELYVDGVLKTTFNTSPPLNASSYTSFADYSIGTLSAGTHTILLKTDSTSAIAESNEGDNQYTKTISVSAATSPNLTPTNLRGGRTRSWFHGRPATILTALH